MRERNRVSSPFPTDPVHKLFPDEQKAAPLVEDFPTGTLGESQEKEDIFSRSVTVTKPDGMGAVSFSAQLLFC